MLCDEADRDYFSSFSQFFTSLKHFRLGRKLAMRTFSHTLFPSIRIIEPGSVTVRARVGIYARRARSWIKVYFDQCVCLARAVDRSGIAAGISNSLSRRAQMICVPSAFFD